MGQSGFGAGSRTKWEDAIRAAMDEAVGDELGADLI
jgi:hypothetical protein